MKKLILIIFGFLLSTNAFAIGAVTATVVQVRVDSNGYGMVFFSQPIGGTPATCSIPVYRNAYGFDTNTAGGRAVLAWALAARASGVTVTAYGLGTCAIYGVVEDWDYGVSN